MKIAYLECFSGISGDMFLGALIDAGVPSELLQQTVASLGLGATLGICKVDRSGISSTKVDVLVANEPAGHATDRHAHSHSDAYEDNHERQGHAHSAHLAHVHSHSQEHAHTHSHGEAVAPDKHGGNDHSHEHGRSLSIIRELIQRCSIDPAAKALAWRAFNALGQAEAKIHNVPVEHIHFHEVGAVDAIVDIVATAVGCLSLGIDQWYCSALNVGGGSVACAHGTFPVPAPATLDLLKGAPIYSAGPQKELVTPTGAALVRALDVNFGAVPSMRPEKTGYGAGTRDFPRFPNAVRLTIGESNTGHSEVAPGATRIGIIETTIDDSNPQIIAYASELLLAAGASDVIRTAVQMKKGRTGVQISVLCSPRHAEKLQAILFRETSTIGLRYREEQKLILPRTFSSVNTQWGPVQIKVATTVSGEITNAAPEFEDCKRLAVEWGVPLKHVMDEAMRLYRGWVEQAH